MSAVAELPRADGVEYIDLVPGLLHFRCDRINGTLSTATCSARAAEAENEKEFGKFSACLNCPIGLVHRGQDHPLRVLRDIAATTGATRDVVAAANKSQGCARCGRTGLRILPSAKLCVSCYNREREFRVGRNSRGTVPVTFKPLRTWRVGIVLSGERTYALVPNVQSEAEAIARLIKQYGGAIGFHDDQPAPVFWNAEAGWFEYRTSAGEALLEVVYDGLLTYMPVAELRPGEQPAKVRAPTRRMTVHEAAQWLTGDEDAEQLTSVWLHQGIVCRACGVSQVHARKHSGRIEAKCLACEDSTAPRPARPTYYGGSRRVGMSTQHAHYYGAD